MIHVLCGETHLHDGETDFLHWQESPLGPHATQYKQNKTLISFKHKERKMVSKALFCRGINSSARFIWTVHSNQYTNDSLIHTNKQNTNLFTDLSHNFQNI